MLFSDETGRGEWRVTYFYFLKGGFKMQFLTGDEKNSSRKLFTGRVEGLGFAGCIFLQGGLDYLKTDGAYGKGGGNYGVADIDYGRGDEVYGIGDMNYGKGDRNYGWVDRNYVRFDAPKRGLGLELTADNAD